MTVPVYLWIVFHEGEPGEGEQSQFFASTVDEPPDGLMEFLVGDARVVELSPEDVETIARIWAEAQGV